MASDIEAIIFDFGGVIVDSPAHLGSGSRPNSLPLLRTESI